MRLIPSSNGEDNAPLQELNPCHRSQDGRFGRRGECGLATATQADRSLARFTVAPESRIFLQHVFGPGADIRGIAAGMVRDCRAVYAVDVVARRSLRDGRSKVKFTFSGSDGTMMERIFEREGGKLIVHHDMFDVGEYAEPGEAKLALRSAMDVYEHIGVSEIRTFANIDVGSYAWAKFGFSTLPGLDTSLMHDSLRNVLKAAVKRGFLFVPQREPKGEMVPVRVTPELARRIRKVIGNNPHDTHTVWRVSDLTAGGAKIGKALLFDMGWSAKLSLSDSDAMARFNRYTGRGPTRH